MAEEDIKELFDAIARNDESTVKRLIEVEGVPTTCLDAWDQTIAHASARHGNLNILKYICDKDPSVLPVLDFHGESVIFRAIEGGQLEVVKYLVENRGVNVSQPHTHCFGNSPIHKAAEEGNLAILKYFLEEKNGDVNIRNTVQQTPVFVAAEGKHLDVIKYLVEERNADLTGLDYRRCNILYTSVNCNDWTLLKYILDERKAPLDVDWKDESDLTLVHRAAILNRFHILEYLVNEKHADVNIPDKWGKTPLHSAARWNYYDVCKLLIENGANLRAKDDHDQLPINEASEQRLVDYMAEAASASNTSSAASPSPSPSPPHNKQRRSAQFGGGPSVLSLGVGGGGGEKLMAIPARRVSPVVPPTWEDATANLQLAARSFSSAIYYTAPLIQSFLVIAQMTMVGRRRSPPRSQYELVRHTPTLTPSVETAQIRGDPFVENAVRTLPRHFSKPFENHRKLF